MAEVRSRTLSTYNFVGLLILKIAGYSWLSNQHGLTIDNIVAYELVLPDGTIQTVDQGTPDLLYGLKVSIGLAHRKSSLLITNDRVATTIS